MAKDEYEEMANSAKEIVVSPEDSKSPPTPLHPIYLPNISTVPANPVVDETFPKRLEGYVSEDEHHQFMENVNGELKKLAQQKEQDKEIDRFIWPTKGVFLLFICGLLFLGGGLFAENNMLTGLGVVISIVSLVVLVACCCYLVYLIYVQETITEEVEEAVSEMSCERFSARGVNYRLQLDGDYDGCLVVSVKQPRARTPIRKNGSTGSVGVGVDVGVGGDDGVHLTVPGGGLGVPGGGKKLSSPMRGSPMNASPMRASPNRLTIVIDEV